MGFGRGLGLSEVEMAYDPTYRHQYYLDHKDHALAYGRSYTAVHRERYRAHSRRWYRQNGMKQNKEAAAARKAVREIVRILKTSPCADCGCCYPTYVMDFDHVRGKKLKCVGQMQNYTNLGLVLDEIAKCELVCSNCHRIRTHIRKNQES